MLSRRVRAQPQMDPRRIAAPLQLTVRMVLLLVFTLAAVAHAVAVSGPAPSPPPRPPRGRWKLRNLSSLDAPGSGVPCSMLHPGRSPPRLSFILTPLPI